MTSTGTSVTADVLENLVNLSAKDRGCFCGFPFCQICANTDQYRREAVKYAALLAGEVLFLRGVVAQHDLCHDLHGKVGVEDFAKGCASEIKRVYGTCPWEERIKELICEIEALKRKNNDK